MNTEAVAEAKVEKSYPFRKGLIFDVATARKIVLGEKTQTRRAIKPQPEKISSEGVVYAKEWRDPLKAYAPEDHPLVIIRPRFAAGDIVWVREAWNLINKLGDGSIQTCHTEPREEMLSEGWEIAYAADCQDPEADAVTTRWRPAIHMPRWASRLDLKINSIRVEQLQSLSEEDAKAEGVLPYEDSYVSGFSYLWDSLNQDSAFAWEKNPYVWVIEFEIYKEV